MSAAPIRTLAAYRRYCHAITLNKLALQVNAPVLSGLGICRVDTYSRCGASVGAPRVSPGFLRCRVKLIGSLCAALNDVAHIRSRNTSCRSCRCRCKESSCESSISALTRSGIGRSGMRPTHTFAHRHLDREQRTSCGGACACGPAYVRWSVSARLARRLWIRFSRSFLRISVLPLGGYASACQFRDMRGRDGLSCQLARSLADIPWVRAARAAHRRRSRAPRGHPTPQPPRWSW